MLAATTQPSARNSDETLLRTFAESGSQNAFGFLVEKYLGMVLGIATRRTNNHSLAEEIAQNVFAVLARKAKSLKPNPTLAGWLHRVTVIECAEAIRREATHQSKMKAVSQHLASEHNGRDVWRDALPLLDDGINALGRAERQIVLLRFFERKSFREIGTALGKTEDAAQKQTERALEKLSRFLQRKGVTVSAAVLGAGLAAHVAQAAPAALAHAIAHGAIASASTFNSKILILKALEAMTNTKLKTAALATVALAIPLTMQWAENSRLREALKLAQQPQQILAAATQSAPTFAGNFATPSSTLGTRVGLPTPDSSSSSSSTSPVSPDTTASPEEWAHVLFIADPLERSQRLARLLAGLTAENAPKIAEAFEQAKNAGIRFADEQRLFLRAWGRVGGSAAVEYAVKHGGQSSDEAVAALGGWASTAPRLAQAWLEALPDSNEKETLVYGLLDGWSTSDFAAAAAYAESRPKSAARDSFRELLLQRALRSGGITAAQNWVTRISESDQNHEYKKRAFSEVIQAMLYRDPAAAARWITELDGKSYVGAEAVTNTAAKLAEASPTGALKWLTSLQPADTNTVASSAGAVLKNWASQDAQAAGTWLQQNTNHPHYDQMTAGYARTVASVDRAAAEEWVQTIRNPELQKKALASLAPKVTTTYAISNLKGELALTSTYGSSAAINWIDPRQHTVDTVFFSEVAGDFVTPSKVTGEGLIELGLSVNPRKPNPHGPGAQWKNCASCHAQ